MTNINKLLEKTAYYNVILNTQYKTTKTTPKFYAMCSDKQTNFPFIFFEIE